MWLEWSMHVDFGTIVDKRNHKKERTHVCKKTRLVREETDN